MLYDQTGWHQAHAGGCSGRHLDPPGTHRLLGGFLLLVLVSYLVITWLIRRALLRIVRRIPTDFDDRLLAAVGDDIRWLVVILTLRFATTRLVFVSAGLKALLNDACYVIGLLLVVSIVFKLIDLAGDWVRERSRAPAGEEELEPLTVLLTRLGRVLVVVLGLTVLLSHFGVNVVAFATTLGLAGLAISLAAKDTIMPDRPSSDKYRRCTA